MKRVGVLVLLVGVAVAQEASTAAGKQWNERLVVRKDVAGATKLCTGWEKSGTAEEKLEAEKCLTAIVLQGAPLPSVKEMKAGAPKYSAPVADEALGHIERGLALTPDDLKLNLGRLFVLAEAHRYEAVGPAFEATLKAMPGEEFMPYWQQTIGDLVQDGVPRAALAVAEVLLKHFPESHEVAGNVGSVHDVMKEWSEGLPYQRKAVELAPNDAIDTWNLGWALDHLGQLDEADKWMSASLKLPSDDASLGERRCLYGRFLVVERKQTARGCALVKSACGRAVVAGCAVGTGAAKGKGRR